MCVCRVHTQMEFCLRALRQVMLTSHPAHCACRDQWCTASECHKFVEMFKDLSASAKSTLCSNVALLPTATDHEVFFHNGHDCISDSRQHCKQFRNVPMRTH